MWSGISIVKMTKKCQILSKFLFHMLLNYKKVVG